MCRCMQDKTDEMLLVELEDLNSYLSILELGNQTKEKFLNALVLF